VADNSAALRRARRQDSRTKHERASDALTAIEHSGEPITFPAVGRRAGVSVSFLYADAELSSRIATARDRQRQAGADRAWRLPARSLVTEQSLRADLANAKERGRRLAEEVTVLRERLSRHLGAAADVARGEALSPLLDQLEHRAAELEADNHRQRQRIGDLEAELRDLTETLDAARAMNRELMTELNRRSTPVGVGARSSGRARSPSRGAV
jgi:asparagine synthetase B (glutamine-hydrolysing)